MTSRKPAKITKHIILYNDLFHYVEDNETNDVQFALFKVYNLNRSFGELRKEIFAAVGDDEATTVTSIDDFSKSDSSSESSMDESFIAVNASVKIKISFKSQKHRDVIEHLRSSQAIKDLTQNGFADWVPLDSKSYINIERNSKFERQGILQSGKLRSFDEDIDSNLLDMIINEIYQNEIDKALEKLFPGPIITINREVNEVCMRVVVFEIRHDFDQDIGRLFVEVLNALIEDRKLNSKSEAISSAFSTLVYRLFAVIRNLTYLDELYGEFKLPSWAPFISQPKIKEIRDKIPMLRASEEDALLDIVEFTTIDEPLNKLRPLIKQLHGEVEVAQRKVNDAAGRWKTPKRASNALFYGSMAGITAIPSTYYYNYRTAGSVSSSSNRLKVSIGVLLLSIVLGLWSKKSHHDFHKAINFVKQIDPLLSSSKNNVESLEQWLDKIADDDKFKIKVDNYEYKRRKMILKQLFHKFALANSNIRNSFSIA